ncbi:MAG TPA: GAF domain-containing sensor histidine kinase [Candidatus Limnocylindrales bacterium]
MTVDSGELDRLRAAVERGDARRDAVDEAARAIAQVLDVDDVLQLIVDRVRALVRARWAALGIVDRYGFIEQFITSGISDADRARIGAPPVGHGLLGLIIREHRSYRIPEIAAHPDSAGFPPNHPPMTSFLGVPVLLKGRAVGNFYLTDKEGALEFTEEDQQVVELFASHAAIAIENARLHEQVRRLAVVDERERIGRDLHDGVIQSLYAVTLGLEDVPDLMAEAPDEAATRVDRAIESIHTTIHDLRNFIFGLRPELLDRATLLDSIRTLADELGTTTGLEVEQLLDPVAALGLDDERSADLLHVAHEAMSNVARHANATHATVEFRSDGRDSILVVADDGAGFDPSVDRSGTHQGLPNMRRRIEESGGQLHVESAVGGGTRIIVRVPRSNVTAAEGLT